MRRSVRPRQWRLPGCRRAAKNGHQLVQSERAATKRSNTRAPYSAGLASRLAIARTPFLGKIARIKLRFWFLILGARNCSSIAPTPRRAKLVQPQGTTHGTQRNTMANESSTEMLGRLLEAPANGTALLSKRSSPSTTALAYPWVATPQVAHIFCCVRNFAAVS